MRISKPFTYFLILTLLLSAAGCGGDVQESTDTTAAGTSLDTTTEASTTDIADTMPPLDLKGKVIRIAYGEDNLDQQLDEMYAESETGDIVSDSIFRRNLAVEERLNVKLEFLPGQPNDKFIDDVRKVISAGDDAYDIVDSMMWRINPAVFEGMFHELTDAPYLNIDQPWWYKDLIETSSIQENRFYLVTGAQSIQTLRYMSCVFVNKSTFTDFFGSVDDFYAEVLDGKWTYDRMSEMSKTAFRDLNANGKADEADELGAGVVTGSMSEHFSISSGYRFSERNKDCYPELIGDQSRNVDIVEKLYSLYYETEGVMISGDVGYYDYLTGLFGNGTMLFLPFFLNGTDYLRDSVVEYGIIPRPKLSEEDDYITSVHDRVTMFGVPVTVPDIDPICAVLESMAIESHRYVIPGYYETALKVKYTHDDISAQMIDMIRSKARTDFIYTSGISIRLISRDFLAKGSKDYMSMYDSKKTAAAESLAALIETVK
ncbi:MAG: hypothetical protein IJF67_06070 [Clostridia bacterium]|nr:hypothetical protein [Clostridia bacterium]